jgi:hypothetical protein
MKHRSPWITENLKYLGRQVIVTLDDSEESPVIIKGKLLGFCDGGEFEIQHEDGFVHHCWPMLSIREVNMATKLCSCCHGRWQNCDNCQGHCSACDHGTVDG